VQHLVFWEIKYYKHTLVVHDGSFLQSNCCHVYYSFHFFSKITCFEFDILLFILGYICTLWQCHNFEHLKILHEIYNIFQKNSCFWALKNFGNLSFHGIIFFNIYPMRYVLQDQPIMYENKCTYFWVLRFVKF